MRAAQCQHELCGTEEWLCLYLALLQAVVNFVLLVEYRRTVVLLMQVSLFRSMHRVFATVCLNMISVGMIVIEAVYVLLRYERA